MSAGTCVDCGGWFANALMVGAVETGSGPGVIVYACPEHARVRARFASAPEWLREDVAALDRNERK